MARKAAERAAEEQVVPEDATGISYEGAPRCARPTRDEIGKFGTSISAILMARA